MATRVCTVSVVAEARTPRGDRVRTDLYRDLSLIRRGCEPAIPPFLYKTIQESSSNRVFNFQSIQSSHHVIMPEASASSISKGEVQTEDILTLFVQPLQSLQL